MKLSIITLGLMIFSLSAFADHQVVTIGVDRLFIPVGFDDNDNVTAVLDGFLPDPCHTLDETVIVREPGTNVFKIEQKARVQHVACPDVTVPFTKVIDIGNLSQGNYQMELNGAVQKENLRVEKAAEGLPDNFLYAPIDNIRIFVDGAEVYAVLQGRYTSNCLAMQEYKTSKTGDTIQLLPIMKLSEEDPFGQPCNSDIRMFEVAVKLPPMDDQRYLLHVRSLNGESKNLVFNPFINKQ